MGRINIKVVPSSSRDLIVGWLGKSLKIKVIAPPDKGKANIAVIDLLASKLGIDKGLIEVVSGQSSQSKVLLISGFDDCQIISLLKGVSP
jgi:uncharacterized protein